MGDLIKFPNKEKDQLKEKMQVIEIEIQRNIETLQELNQTIVDQTLEYEELLMAYCEKTGIDMPKPKWKDDEKNDDE